MNIKSTLLATALAVAGTTAFAADATQFAQEPSLLTRSEVLAELARARSNGEIAEQGDSYGTVSAQSTAAPGQRTRASVIAELKDAQARGDVPASGDSYGSFVPGELKSVLTRAEVRAQLNQRGHSRGNYKDYAGG